MYNVIFKLLFFIIIIPFSFVTGLLLLQYQGLIFFINYQFNMLYLFSVSHYIKMFKNVIYYYFYISFVSGLLSLHYQGLSFLLIR
jgi:hypothetical protein